MEDELISRDEVVGLLFNVSDIARSLKHLEEMLEGEGPEDEADED